MEMAGEQKDMEKNNAPEQWEVIDIQGLAAILAEKSWEEQTGKVPEQDLYEPIVSVAPGTKEGRLEKQVRPFWANIYFTTMENYKELILSFKKE